MRRFLTLPYLIVAGAFLLGCLIFFPLNFIKPRLQRSLAQAGLDVELGHLHVGTGLGLGLSRGGLFAIHAENVTVTLPQGGNVRCEKFTLSPQLLPLFVGAIKGSALCRTTKQGSLVGTVRGFPFWNPTKFNASVKLDEVDLSLAEGLVPYGPFRGSLKGEILISEMKPNSRTPPRFDWQVQGQNVSTPAVPTDFLSIPALNLGPVSSRGSFAPAKLKLDEFKFGSDKSPLEGTLRADMVIDPRGLPTSGELSGNMRTEPTFEKESLKDINLNLLFGPVRDSGQREFKKTFNGSVLGLLMNPPSEP
jgi:type II secretion system protein N